MNLKRLEIAGFKSFANKTALDFSRGIVAIVGPNGSGKSNIIDAVRWLLGERDSRSLRGGKVEDLIFAGTPGKPSLGMAQASLFFDNESGFFPVDFSEVSVTRKVFRDGASQYFLNKSEVRLKDVVDFFARSRLGTKGLVIINQGNSDIFVKASPAERRIMIEEVLGLREYQLKKIEAEKKLKNTAFNLEKAGAMIGELEPHLRSLKRQTSRWEKRSELESQLKDLEARYFAREAGLIEGDFKKISPLLEEISRDIKDRQKEVLASEKKLAAVEAGRPKQREDLVGIKEKLGNLSESRLKLQKELGRLEAQLDFLSRPRRSDLGLKIEDLSELLKEIRGTIGDCLKKDDWPKIRSELKDLLEKINGAFKTKSGEDDEELKILIGTKEKIVSDLKSLENEIGGLDEAEKRLSLDLDGFNQAFRSAFGELEAAREKLAELEMRKNKLALEKEHCDFRTRELEQRAAQFGGTLAEYIKKSREDDGDPDASFDAATAEKKIFRLRGELSVIGDVDEAILKEARETEERHGFLAAQITDLERASVDLEALIGELNEKIRGEFVGALKTIDGEFNNYFRLMFGGGKAKLIVKKIETKNIIAGEEDVEEKIKEAEEEIGGKEELGDIGIEISVDLPKKRIKSLGMLSGGEKSLVSIAALFALVSVSPPPFLVLDEIDAALDEKNTKRFAALLKTFSEKTQFIIVTHNRATMEAANLLYGVTMDKDGASKVLSLKLE
ncbi:MAG: AAA family ATPase [Parcubacteria group bacterium]|nr:AAA family ATPase [Parcubacteria group bacterium]